jgi:hypothetical protein
MRLKFTENDKDVIVTEIESYINQCPSLAERIEYRKELKSVKGSFRSLYDSGVFHDAIGKVVDVYGKDIGGYGTLVVEVETEY